MSVDVGRSAAAATQYRDVVLSAAPLNRYPFLMMRHIFHDLVGHTGGRAADLGCGRGDHVLALRELGFDAIGIDIEPGEHVTHVCNFGSERIPLDDRSVDVVFSKSVIEHLYLSEIAHYLREIRRILKPGGYCVIVTPDWIYCWDDFYDGYTHVTPFTTRSLEHCMRIHGFMDVHTHILVQLPSVWHSRFMKFLADATRIVVPGVAAKKWHKWIRWSKERQAIGIGRAPTGV